MKTGLTLSQLAAKIEAQRDLKHDLIAPTTDIRMDLSRDDTAERPVITLQAAGTSYPILPLAHDQIGSHTGIPAKYYDRMAAEAPELLVRNVNTWLHFADPGERRMLRTLGGDLRAFLSNRYQRIENEEIAQVALPILADMPGVQIVSAEVTERRMYIQAVTPRITGEVKKGDAVQAGVIISNSEVGHGAVSVAPIVYRLVCLNGMVIPDAKLRSYHVGRLVESSEALWAQDTIQADDRAVLLKVRDTVRGALDEALFQKRVARMTELTEVQFATTASIERGVEVLAKKIGATDTERGGILQALIRGGDLSAWGMLNAVTAQAHTADNYDRGVELETVGGRLLNMARSEWREILEPAMVA
jgi:hypothetical protein